MQMTNKGLTLAQRRAFIQALQKSTNRSKYAAAAFTLVELIIVVVIIGILAATAIPKFLQVKNNAQKKTYIGEAVGLAKECAVFQIAEDDPAKDVINPSTGTAVQCGVSTGTVTITSKPFNASADLAFCLGTTIATGLTTVSITVDQDGTQGCTGA